jgi:glycosyltransferase involved in cell wall biosynthesis
MKYSVLSAMKQIQNQTLNTFVNKTIIPMKYSIIVTSYECYGKGEGFLRENLESVFSQTHRPLQCIVSDHSRDDVIEKMVNSLDSNGCELIYVRYPDNYGNPGHNWNNGLKYANGEFLQYMCMDERLAHNRAVEYIVKFMTETNARWIACAQIVAPTNYLFIPRWNPEILSKNTLSGPAAVVIRNNLRHVELDPQFFWAIDNEWYYRLYLEAGKPIIFNSVCYIGRIHELQMTNTVANQAHINLCNSRLNAKWGSPLPLAH